MGTLPPATSGGLETAGDGRRDEALQALVAAVASRNLEAPATFLLEVARPFHLLIQQVFFASHPLLRPWFGDWLLRWANLLEDAEALEQAQQLLAASRRTVGQARWR